MARHVAERLATDPRLTAIVGGDFNVGETDAGKIGSDPADDETDGYDDTHALLTLGLVNGLRLRSLTKAMGNTYDDTPGDGEFPYPGVGAIDVLYVGGAGEGRFSAGTRGSDTFGSDHYPVRVTIGR
jgi:endonuclease/exonuclease/phosphatase family metal-dependent hydrolase